MGIEYNRAGNSTAEFDPDVFDSDLAADSALSGPWRVWH